MNKKIRIGVIGLGGIGTSTHIPGILATDDGVLTAICDIDSEKVAKVKQQYSIKDELCFEHYQDLIDCDEVDAICICTPNDVHFPVAQYAIKKAKPFALEKPVTLNKTQAQELYNGSLCLPHMVCFSYRFKAAARYAKSLVQSGVIGTINHVYGEYHQSWAISDATRMSWRLQKARTGSGVLGDLGCHMLDLIRFTVGEICEVAGDYGTIKKRRLAENSDELVDVDVDDYFNSIIKLQNGASGTMNTSRFAYGRGNYQQLSIYGTDGAIVYGLEDEDTISVCCGPLSTKNQFVELKIPDEFKVSQMQEFVKVCQGNGSPLSATLTDGYQVQILLDTMLCAADEKAFKPVEIIKR